MHFQFFTEDTGFECRLSTIHHAFPGLELTIVLALKVHKNENFFGFDFEFCTISLLVMSKY